MNDAAGALIFHSSGRATVGSPIVSREGIGASIAIEVVARLFA
jgi:hypothetical protein